MTSPDPSLEQVRFAVGWHLFAAADDTWLLATPDGAFLRITGETGALAACARGERSPGDHSLVAGLRSRGALQTSEPAAVAVRLRVHIEGSDPIAEAAHGLLVKRTEITTGTVDEDVVAGCDALLCSAALLPERRWRQVDDWCRAHGTAWTSCSPEGRHFVLGPAGRPGRSASYGDARGRRLAAAPLPSELAALWGHLETDADPMRTRWPEAAGCAVLAGLLVHDLLAANRDEAPGRQLVVDPDTLTMSSHPVLALPSGIAALSLTR